MFVSNHITAIDPALILLALPGRFRRRVAIAMIGELLRDWRYPSAGTNWILRLFWRVVYDLVVCLFNVFPLPQESGFRRSFAFAGYSMDRGYNLLVFPEGQRTKDGRMNPFLGGIGILASGLSAKIIPVKIEGLFELKQKRRYFAAPGQITVTFGEPLSYSPAEKSEDITKDLEIRVAKL
jgi:long-chain acyl-CoA synthetase